MYRQSFTTFLLALWAVIGITSSASIYQRPLLEVFEEQNLLANGKDAHKKSLRDMLDALEAMQDTYFEMYGGTWPDAIDWTAAVMGTHVSATLSSLVLGLDISQETTSCTDMLDWDNTINKYYVQTSIFYFAENAFSIRTQAYDDMLWVVLGWLENIKFAGMYAKKHWKGGSTDPSNWHGLQMTCSAAHRARIFYELAMDGWDTTLCNGGMTWNPALKPYKNSITNELFAAASIAMYLYYPGDNNTSPYMSMGAGEGIGKQHDPVYLENAVKAYKWLKTSGLQNEMGLYQDGFHITGWHKYPNGTIDPGTEMCDDLDKMIYTYNQGVLLTASRGLWLATGARSYLEDGHRLVTDVMRATGWPGTDKNWRGLGRGGVLEESCDRGGYCSQDGQTFKGIFFTHLTEFCRPLWPQEEDYLSMILSSNDFDKSVYEYHLARCAAYGSWIERNAEAALKTKNDAGLFGMWWGVSPDSRWTSRDDHMYPQELPAGVQDHRNPNTDRPTYDINDLNRRGRGRTVETQSGGLAVLRARWQWDSYFSRS